MNLRVRQNPWRLMLAVNVAVVIGVFLVKIRLPPYVPYIHLLVDYHFGFTKRALIGALVGLFPQSSGLAGVRARRRRLARHARPVHRAVPAHLRLRRRAYAAVRFHGRLAVLPEKFHAHAGAFRHLRLCGRAGPAADTGAVHSLRAARGTLLDDPHPDPPHTSPDVCADHRGHRGAALLPGAGFDRRNVAIGIVAALCVGLLFLAAQFLGTMPVPEAEFVRYLQSRMADPAAPIS